ncbi:MAG: high-potential iron-sulfur protein [Burkholderiaceae bacterium]
MQSRRQFIQILSLSSAALLVGTEARAADLPLVDEKDPTAVALGYVADTTKVNKAKYPNHTPAQQCNNCSLYQGKPGVTSGVGPCPLYAGKAVHANGWCSAYAKRA